MKYGCRNHLEYFEFHDSLWKLHSFQNQTLVFDVRMLNIHHDAPQNPHETDMEIELAQLCFAGAEILSFDLGYAWKTDAEGHTYPEELGGVQLGEAALSHFLNELLPCEHGATIFRFQAEDGAHRLDGCGDSPWFTAQLRFDSVTIEWDAYKKPAWYTEHKW